MNEREKRICASLYTAPTQVLSFGPTHSQNRQAIKEDEEEKVEKSTWMNVHLWVCACARANHYNWWWCCEMQFSWELMRQQGTAFVSHAAAPNAVTCGCAMVRVPLTTETPGGTTAGGQDADNGDLFIYDNLCPQCPSTSCTDFFLPFSFPSFSSLSFTLSLPTAFNLYRLAGDKVNWTEPSCVKQLCCLLHWWTDESRKVCFLFLHLVFFHLLLSSLLPGLLTGGRRRAREQEEQIDWRDYRPWWLRVLSCLCWCDSSSSNFVRDAMKASLLRVEVLIYANESINY